MQKQEWERIFGNKPPPEYKRSWKAIEVANVVFGYNGWTSKIEELVVQTKKDEDAIVHEIFSQALVEVQVFYGNNMEIHSRKKFVVAKGGEGLSNCGDVTRMYSDARKAAVSDAVKNCLNSLFQKVCEWRNIQRLSKAREMLSSDAEKMNSRGMAERKHRLLKDQLDNF